LFRREAPETTLPPSPIITRWEIWLEAAMYYCEHLKTIKKVINLLNADDALAIEKLKNYVRNRFRIKFSFYLYKLSISGYSQV
jgi:hypothetical protein